MNAKTGKGLDALLLVEDEEDHARLIQKALKEYGHLKNPIYWVKNGEEAIEYVTGTGKYNKENAPTPGLILLDIKLPMKGGFEVLEELKSNEMYKTIPVVVLTTTSNTNDIERAKRLGANDYLIKPVEFAKFIDKVGKAGYYWAFISDSNYRINE